MDRLDGLLLQCFQNHSVYSRGTRVWAERFRGPFNSLWRLELLDLMQVLFSKSSGLCYEKIGCTS